ncbi:MAG: hypothetical protein HC896_16585 [Bacteroidales bacterium]|nr:hypothetical protein [Bacteroidales bacterium]
MGSVVSSTLQNVTLGETILVDTQELIKGMYMVKIENKDNTGLISVVKQ